jgi:hypothetical protein
VDIYWVGDDGIGIGDGQGLPRSIRVLLIGYRGEVAAPSGAACRLFAQQHVLRLAKRILRPRVSLPVEEEDLKDLRVGRPTGARRAQAFLGLERKNNRYGHRRQILPSDAYDEVNDRTLETLIRALGRLGIGSGYGGISINNHCGCSCGPPATTATPRVPSLLRKKGKAKKRR